MTTANVYKTGVTYREIAWIHFTPYFIMSDFTLSAARQTLSIAANLEPSIAFGMWELAEKYQNGCCNTGISPSDFETHLFRSYGITDYLLSVILVDGETGNIPFNQEYADSSDDDETYFGVLQEILSILWSKSQQYLAIQV